MWWVLNSCIVVPRGKLGEEATQQSSLKHHVFWAAAHCLPRGSKVAVMLLPARGRARGRVAWAQRLESRTPAWNGACQGCVCPETQPISISSGPAAPSEPPEACCSTWQAPCGQLAGKNSCCGPAPRCLGRPGALGLAPMCRITTLRWGRRLPRRRGGESGLRRRRPREP